MIPPSFARSLEALLTRNVLALRLVTVRLQIGPGTGADLGIADAPFVVTLAGAQVAAGQTTADGELTLLIAPGETLQVQVLDTVYNVSFGPALDALTTLRGQQKRLEVLGYVNGYLLTPAANAVAADGTDGPRTRQAVLNFQSDGNLLIDADIGPNTRTALQTAVGI